MKDAITFLEDLKNFRGYSDREWIVVALHSVSIPKTLQNVGEVPFALRVGATLLWSQLNVKIRLFFLILMAK